MAKYGKNLIVIANTCPCDQKLAQHLMKQVIGQDLATFTHKKIMKNQKMLSCTIFFGNIKNDSIMKFGYFPNIVRENVAKAWPKANSHI